MSNYAIASTQNATVDFPVSKDRYFLSFSPFSSLFPQTVLIQNVAFTHWKKASAPGKFEMVMKHPTLASFHVRNSSNNQDKLSPSTSGENTNACLPSIPDAKNTSMFHFNETTD